MGTRSFCVVALFFFDGVSLNASDLTFERDVQPILAARCGKCHGQKTRKADLNLVDFAAFKRGGESGDLVEAGDAVESLLFEMITDGSMPPEDEPSLNAEQIDVIRQWIESGADGIGHPSGQSPEVSYAEIVPLMLRRCVMCHGPEYQFGGVDLREHALMLKGGANGSVLVSGEPEESLMVTRVVKQLCPPQADIGESGIEPMTPTELKRLKQWITGGAKAHPMQEDVATAEPDPLVTDDERQFWSFVPPQKTPPPTVNPELIRTDIDAFVLAKLNGAGLAFSAEADRTTLARRAAFTLTGLPPSDSLCSDFVDDDSAEAWPRLLDRLLDSPRYGEKWGRFWLDLAGYSDSEGKRSADSVRPFAWRYRDWVIKAFNDDKPYSDFLVEQLAGDELVDWADESSVTDDVISKLTATGFLRMVPDGTAADPVNRFPDRMEVISDAIDVVSRGVMGLTMNCARCHTHKYDPIPQRDYYRMVAVFKGAYDEYDWLTPHAFNNQWKNSKQRLLEVFRPDQRAEIKEQQQQTQQRLDEITAELKQKGLSGDEKKKLKTEQTQLAAKLRQSPKIRALWDRGRPSPTFLYRRGDETQPGTLVGPGVPSMLTDGRTPFQPVVLKHSTPKTGRRLAFARWLTTDDHPLTSRVIVNRIWQQHFGRGLVESGDNFGKLGTLPSHPKLLDWLAVDFVEHGWSIKRLHRQIMTSAVWMQRSTVTDVHRHQDPDNRLLSRMPMRRLSAEEVRDTMLLVAARLNETPYGKPDAVDVRKDGLVTSKPVDGKWRRSVYVRQRRKEMPTVFEAFDLPQMTPNCTERTASTVVTQSLYLLNNRMVFDLAHAFATRVQSEAGDDETQLVTRAFEIALNRQPSDEEREASLYAIRSIEQELAAEATGESDSESESSAGVDVRLNALAGFCHGLLNSASLLYVD
ncbi:MAG: PSD1 and planctomycete cytochrome C domain-containing protein [Fuerstiella sp.]